MNTEKFENPILEVEEIETKDIITASTGDNEEEWPGGWNRATANGERR